MRRSIVAAGLLLSLWIGVGGSTASAQSASTAPPAAKAFTEQEAEFVLGNVIFVLFHEFGHALVSEFELPVLGREEDAVDRFATFLLTPDGDEDEAEDPSTILIDAMKGWFAASKQTALADIAWWDEHGPDQQRAYQIACLLYGADPKKFGAMAKEVKLPEDRMESCPSEAESNSQSWVKVAKPHALEDGEKPKRSITATYGSAGDYRLERDLLKESQLLEGIAAQIGGTFRLPRNLTVAARQCGEANAYWDADEAEVRICYELVREYRELYGQAKR